MGPRRPSTPDMNASAPALGSPVGYRDRPTPTEPWARKRPSGARLSADVTRPFPTPRPPAAGLGTTLESPFKADEVPTVRARPSDFFEVAVAERMASMSAKLGATFEGEVDEVRADLVDEAARGRLERASLWREVGWQRLLLMAFLAADLTVHVLGLIRR